MTDTRLLYTAAVPFEAARRVHDLPDGHRSRRLHGHGFLAKLRAAVPDGWASFPGGQVAELTAALAEAVGPLDHQYLNDRIEVPTDENIARWIRAALTVPGVSSVGIQSTLHRGADLDRDDHVHVWRRYLLQSAHRLPNVPPGHKCGRMHGHGFEVILHANQTLGASSHGVDYDHLDALWAPIHAELDHACLNEVHGLENPTSEMISSWLWTRLKPKLPELSWVTVYETAQCGANFDGTHYRIWKEFTVDSAVQFRAAPAGDKRRRIHGHTYTLRLHLNAPLDRVMGWTVDFGDVKQLFDPVFKRIDHHPLYDLPGLTDGDVGPLIEWLRRSTVADLPQIDRIDLYETRGCGAIATWGGLAPALPV